MPESAVWGQGHWGLCYWGQMYLGALAYRIRPTRRLKTKLIPRDYFIRHMQDWPVLLQYLMLKRRRKQNEQT